MIKTNRKKGFSFIEIAVVIAVLAVLVAILAPALISQVELSRMQKDESSMDEVCNAIQLALADSNTFDEAFSYCINNNYLTYSDSSGVYSKTIADEEFWAPDGAGAAVTITFNPENGKYDISKGIVNDMTYGNGSVAEKRTAEGNLQQCYFSEMGNQLLYSTIMQSIGETVSETSATYKNSSYTIFIRFHTVDGTRKADVYGQFNGTNLSEGCPAAEGSYTDRFDIDSAPISKNPTGGTKKSDFTSSDLSGGGSVGSVVTRPSYKPCDHPGVTKVDNINHRCDIEDCQKLIPHEINPNTKKCVCGYHEHNFDNNHTCTICGYQGPGIYDTNTGKLVFTWDELITKGIIQETGNTFVKYVYQSSLNGKKLVFREGITEIADSAFRCCTLKEVVLPEGLLKIGNQAFSDYGAQYSYLEKINIPDSVTYLGDDAFKYSRKLQEVNIPKGITCINSGAFNTCSQLTHITIPEGVTNIYGSGSYSGAFANCKNLKTVDIPQSMQKMNDGVFSGCSGLETIKISKNIEYGQRVYEGAGNDNTNVIIDEGITTIKPYLLAGINGKDIKIPDSVTKIENYGFALAKIKKVTIPDSVTSIGVAAFNNCSNLQSIDFPCSVTTIGANAFSGCESLTELIIPKNITSMGTSAFARCSKLNTVVFEDGTTSKAMGNYMFSGCYALNSVILPTSIDTMVSKWFNGVVYGDGAAPKPTFYSIYYKGTPEQWNKIKNVTYYGWREYSPTSSIPNTFYTPREFYVDVIFQHNN